MIWGYPHGLETSKLPRFPALVWQGQSPYSVQVRPGARSVKKRSPNPVWSKEPRWRCFTEKLLWLGIAMTNPCFHGGGILDSCSAPSGLSNSWVTREDWVTVNPLPHSHEISGGNWYKSHTQSCSIPQNAPTFHEGFKIFKGFHQGFVGNWGYPQQK